MVKTDKIQLNFRKKYNFASEMQIQILKSKIHKVRVTEANLEYQGSITIDEDLLDAAGMHVYEKVQVLDINNGERLETYVIKGKRASGVICMNGPAARKTAVGDILIIISYGLIDENEAANYQPVVIFPDTHTNRLP